MSGPEQTNTALHLCVCVCVRGTFLLVFVDVHLPVLLEAQRVDNGHGQSQGFPGVAVGTQGVDAGARRRNVVCAVKREGGGGWYQRTRTEQKYFAVVSRTYFFHSVL